MDTFLNILAIIILVSSALGIAILAAARIEFGDNDFSDEEAERLVREAFGGHEDVMIDVDGQPQRVFGDPNMSEETKKALAVMIKAAAEAVERGDFDNDEESQ